MTLISVHSGEGCVGRCDSRCYNALGPVCVCCCGGANHGKGLQYALDNTSEQAQDLLEKWGDALKVHPLQEELFEEVPV